MCPYPDEISDPKNRDPLITESNTTVLPDSRIFFIGYGLNRTFLFNRIRMRIIQNSFERQTIGQITRKIR